RRDCSPELAQKSLRLDWPQAVFLRRGLLGARRPVVDFALDLFLSLPIMLLEAAGELFAIAVDHVKVVIREFAPLLLNLALKLLPISFDLIPVHGVAPYELLLPKQRDQACLVPNFELSNEFADVTPRRGFS